MNAATNKLRNAVIYSKAFAGLQGSQSLSKWACLKVPYFHDFYTVIIARSLLFLQP